MRQNIKYHYCYFLVIGLACLVTLAPFDSHGSDVAHPTHEPQLTEFLPPDNTARSPMPGPEPLRGPTPSVIWQSFPAPPEQSSAYSSAKLADINLDGNLDIVAGYGTTGIHVWVGDGQGGWTPFASPTSASKYDDVAVGDINNDGKPDIVGASSAVSSGIKAWTGDANGAWTDISPPVTGRPFYSLALDDVNLDGNLDIISGSKGQSMYKAIWVWLGNGAGGWTAGDTNLPTSGSYTGVTTGDFNQDGYPDIAGTEGGVYAWIGDGAGGWTLRNNGLPDTGAFVDVELNDFNHDGMLDLVATDEVDGGVRVWNGDGWGTWYFTLNLPFSGNYNGVETADLNLDGYMDILTASSNSDLTVWSGDGLDNWYLQTIGLETGKYHTTIASGDLNNDGRVDICMIDTDGVLDIWESTVERAVNKWTDFSAPATTGTANDVLVFDVNLDGKLDVCYAFQTKGLEIWKGNGNGTWSAFPSPASTGNFNSVVSADFNKDGMPDLIATSGTWAYAWVGNGAGTWTQRREGLPDNWGVLLGLSVADFNDDGNPDIALGLGSDNGLAVYNGDGWGSWTMTFNLPLFVGTYYDLDSADVNNDGAIDLVAATGGIKVFLGDANDGWTESSTGLPGSSDLYKSVKTAEINNDAKMDIIGVSDSYGANSWLGNGAGQWSLDSNIVPSHGCGLAVADFSIDGKQDVCVGSSQNTGVLASKRSGSSWATVSSGLSQTGDFTSMAFADVNIDGRQDIITFNNTGQNPHIWVGDYEAPPSFNISVHVGWNLLSRPLLASDTSVPAVFTDIDGNTTWTYIQSYNASDVSDHWKTRASFKLAGLNDLTNVDQKMGVWLCIPDATALGDGIIRVTGTVPAGESINLKAGWNLVGYPSLTQKSVTDALAGLPYTSVEGYSATDPYRLTTLAGSYMMTPGEAYWILVTSDCMWTLNW